MKSLLKLLSSGVDNAVGNAALAIGNCAKDSKLYDKIRDVPLCVPVCAPVYLL